MIYFIGITSTIPHFLEAGVTCVWLSPIYESPMADFGYDISNFTAIDPIFGTWDDFVELSNALKAAGT
jgi:alpha-glucosidase